MTQKQLQILAAALRLFATEGYASTTTKKIAQEAKVSEGLIFRHFTNKEGLLKALLEEGVERGKKYFADIVLEADPLKIIQKMISLPFQILPEEYEFWRLQHSLKWQTDSYDSSITEPLKIALVRAFTKLKYKSPELEADYLMIQLDGVVSTLLLHPDTIDPIKMEKFILKRYQLK
ncbi:MAG: TetR family transcriptional regulator [Crocinitomicaceae bacterium]|nr:TetR family transcriptional regulator [Crocinitomicaceae bacterium]|tara:strand:- start:12615 stop:13142 length:528 start_codon:yes stop_codon:yes gene_type:complete